MSPLEQKIVDRIRSESPVSFETFMEMALYYPGLGYYTKDATKIGRKGDFYTSPHLHRIFGAMIGRQMEEMWRSMGRPDIFQIVEMGAGMGYLAKDMMEHLKRARGKGQGARNDQTEDKGQSAGRTFFDTLKYTIIEMNPSMREHQRELLKDFSDRVAWRSDLDETEAFEGCLLSNELLDAFPVRIVEMDDEPMEIRVSTERIKPSGEFSEEDVLREVKRPCSEEVREYLRDFSVDLPKGYRTEINLRIKDWLGKVDEKLSKGFVLTIDYGYPAWEYYDEERSRGTLLCYHHHQMNEDPYRNIGEQDITAHVNFSSLKKWGEELGLKTLGFCAQGTYLVSLGIDEAITELYGNSPDAFDVAKIKGLILPQGMGESHKVMVQYKGEGEPKLRGFALRNQAGKL